MTDHDTISGRLRANADTLDEIGEALAAYPDARDGMRRAAAMDRQAAQALEDVTRDNAAKDRAIVDLKDALVSYERVAVERDALVAQIARAREALNATEAPYKAVADARRILSDPDPSAGLRAIQADAWDEGYDAGHRDGVGREHGDPEDGVNPYRIEEADEWSDPEPYVQVYSVPERAPFSRWPLGGNGTDYQPRTREQYDTEEADHAD